MRLGIKALWQRDRQHTRRLNFSRKHISQRLANGRVESISYKYRHSLRQQSNVKGIAMGDDDNWIASIEQILHQLQLIRIAIQVINWDDNNALILSSVDNIGDLYRT